MTEIWQNLQGALLCDDRTLTITYATTAKKGRPTITQSALNRQPSETIIATQASASAPIDSRATTSRATYFINFLFADHF